MLKSKISAFHDKAFNRITRLIAQGIVLTLILFQAGCSFPNPTRIAAPSVSPQVVITRLTAEAHGKLIQSGGCLYLYSADINKNFALVWQPGFLVTIEGNNVKVKIGMPDGRQKEVVLQIGENLVLGGGTFDQLNEENQKLNPAGCPGPYWLVGELVSHSP